MAIYIHLNLICCCWCDRHLWRQFCKNVMKRKRMSWDIYMAISGSILLYVWGRKGGCEEGGRLYIFYRTLKLFIGVLFSCRDQVEDEVDTSGNEAKIKILLVRSLNTVFFPKNFVIFLLELWVLAICNYHPVA